jgi:hypothetical protein
MPNALRSALFASSLLALIGSLLLFAAPNAAQSQVKTATPTSLSVPTLALRRQRHAYATALRARLAYAEHP